MGATESSPYTPFALSVFPDRDEVAVVAVGELDMASVDELASTVTDLKESGWESVLIDLRDVEFIDSTGLKLLLSLRNDAHSDGHSLALLPPERTVGRIFDVTRTRGLFHWRDRFPR